MSMHDGLPVSGYRPQSTKAVDVVNANKEIEERVLRRLDELKAMGTKDVDQRWLAIGRTHIELAWMAINRAVFQPARAALPEETNKGPTP